ncbi:MAG TPA: GNAT family N-acetyltransferase [Ktedonobacteraceae bacterium]|nr:GNAT family N-acetyltransferase [Ktedonobacteraceae bacterium]
MPKITMREVTRDNWQEALSLAVFPEQQHFVADYEPVAAIALAKAYIRPGGLVWTPYAFYADATMVGFTELAYEPGSAENYWFFHFFIDSHYQGQGYGKQALQILLQFIKARFAECRTIYITVHPENERAIHLYTAAGFQPTGEERWGEAVYRLSLHP